MYQVWRLLHGVDDTEVAKAKDVPHQISIVSYGHLIFKRSLLTTLQEDSYIRLDDVEQVEKQLRLLSGRLLKQMRLDLVDGDYLGIAVKREQEDPPFDTKATSSRRWIAHPKTLRLSTRTRPRPPLNPDGTQFRTFNRISKSSSMPSFVFSLAEEVTVLAAKLVEETLLPLFRKLHPEKSAWNLSLVNLCATNMSMSASESKSGAGRDIVKMLRRQEDVLKHWKVADVEVAPSKDEPNDRQMNQDDTNEIECGASNRPCPGHADLEDAYQPTQVSFLVDEAWESEGQEDDLGDKCQECGAMVPPFAVDAHERFHSLSVDQEDAADPHNHSIFS